MKRNGFTLIELVIVISIVVILIAIAVPAVRDYGTPYELVCQAPGQPPRVVMKNNGRIYTASDKYGVWVTTWTNNGRRYLQQPGEQCEPVRVAQ